MGKVSSTGGANESEDSVEAKHAEKKTSEGIRVLKHEGGNRGSHSKWVTAWL